MNHFPESYLIFLAGLGWMVVSWTVVPEIVGRRPMWWLVGFSLCTAFNEAIRTTLLKYDFDQEGFATSQLTLLFQLATAALLLEFLRRSKPPEQDRPLGRWVHVFTTTAAVIVILGHASVAQICVRGFAIAVLAATARQFWCLAPAGDPRRRGLRLATAGFASLALAVLLGVLLAPPIGTTGYTLLAVACATAPWLVCLGTTEAFLTLLGARSYAARCFLLCLALTPICSPLIESSIMPRLDTAARSRAVRVAEENTRLFDPAIISRLAAGTATTADHAAIDTQLAAFRTWKVAPERTYLWTLRDGGVVPLSHTTGELPRDTTDAERTAAVAHTRFLRSPLSDGWTDWLSANGPFPGTSPTVWLALEYRVSDWRHVMETARYMLTGSLAIFAIFLTVGIVLTWRRALENRRFATLRDTESASHAKTEFLSFLSHELRTPLQSILGRAELLARTSLAPGQQRHLETINAQGQLLLRLVTDLLDLGTIEAGKFVLRPASFSLRRTLAACEDVARRQAEGKAISVDVIVDPAIPDAFIADETRLRQILGNLLNNAVKYTTTGTVTLRVSPDSQRSTSNAQPGERLAFAVHDTGPGLPPAQLDRLFTLFTRLDPGEGFRREGTGVGLALVRRLCTLMGGTVTAANRPEGGAVFTVQLTLPLAEASFTVAATSDFKPPAGTSALRVLVVDDNTAARELLTEALRDAGHIVEAAPDAHTALASYAAHPSDVIVLDLNLPDLDGLEVTRRIRALAAPAPGPRIVGCSAEAFATSRTAALAAGMDAFLEKPVRLTTLLSVVAPFIATPPPSPTTEGLALASNDDVFSRLRGADQLARTREIWAAEWPPIRAHLDTAVTACDPDAVIRHTHYLRSTALLLGDTTLANTTRDLAAAAQAGDWPAARACLEELVKRAGALPPSP